MRIRVLIVDDHPVVVDGLRGLLSQEPDVETVGGVGTVADARAALAAGDVDVVLLDIRLPDGSGIDLLHDASRQAAPPAFIVLSTFESPQYVDAALRSGASGYLLKTAPGPRIVAAVREVAAGGTAFSGEQLQALRAGSRIALSRRDREVVALLLEGRSNAEIAGALGIAPKTVERHLGRLFARHGVLSRTELALRADREQWLAIPPDPD